MSSHQEILIDLTCFRGDTVFHRYIYYPDITLWIIFSFFIVNTWCHYKSHGFTVGVPNRQPTGHTCLRMDTNATRCKAVNLLKTWRNSSVVSVCNCSPGWTLQMTMSVAKSRGYVPARSLAGHTCSLKNNKDCYLTDFACAAIPEYYWLTDDRHWFLTVLEVR